MNGRDDVVLTYGTFDLFHVGHLRLLKRLKGMGGRLVVGVSTDEFNLKKGKKCIIPYEQRAEIVGGLSCVDEVFPESSWEQKRGDVVRYGASVFAMGNDWLGKFDELKDLCKVVYLERTEGVSTTELKALLSVFDAHKVEELKRALELVMVIAEDLR